MRAVIPLLAMGFITGCATERATQAPLLTSVNAGRAGAETAGEYRLGCPDIVELRFTRNPEWNAIASVGVDGRLPLGKLGEVVAGGLTLLELRESIAKLGGLPVEEITAMLYEARSKYLTVFGPERNRQQNIVYCGPERVLDLLRRSRALQPGCSDPRELAVVRSNVAVGAPAEVIRVDLESIVERGDDSTNIVLQPGDQIHVGELRRSSLYRLLPEWLKPTYQKWMGLWTGQPKP